jgi:bifunctional non-homologous end joining protein LigD
MKFNGYLLGARLSGGKVAMLTRRGLDWTDRFRPIVDELRLLKRRDAYLDGEVVALTPAGISDFGSLREALSSHQTNGSEC